MPAITDATLDIGANGQWKAAQGTITADKPAWNSTATWNDVAVTHTHLKANVTDTASAAASLLADLQVGGVSKFKVSKAGLGTFADGVVATTGTFSGPVSMAALTATTGAFSSTADATTLNVVNTHATFSSFAHRIAVSRAANAGYYFQYFTANGVEQFSVKGNGAVNAVGPATFTSTVAVTGVSTLAKVRTASGSAVCASGAATTLFAVPSVDGVLKVYASDPDSNASVSAAAAEIIGLGGTFKITATNGSGLSLTLSGSNLQATQTSGISQTVSYIYTWIAA